MTLTFMSHTHRDLWVVKSSGGSLVRTGIVAALRRSGLAPVGLIEPGGWSENRLVFALPRPNTRNLWEIEPSRNTWTVAGSPKQLTSGSGFEAAPRVADNGQVVFTSELRRTHLWAVTVGPEGTISRDLV